MQAISKKGSKFLIPAVLVLLITGIAGYLLYNKPHRNIENTKAEHILSVGEIMNEFQTDTEKASDKYIGKVIKIKGTAQSVNIDAATANILLADDGDFFGVNCSFSGDYVLIAKTVKQGDIVTIKGECKGFLDDVIMNNCIVIE
jgi:hypothetical protein